METCLHAHEALPDQAPASSSRSTSSFLANSLAFRLPFQRTLNVLPTPSSSYLWHSSGWSLSSKCSFFCSHSLLTIPHSHKCWDHSVPYFRFQVSFQLITSSGKCFIAFIHSQNVDQIPTICQQFSISWGYYSEWNKQKTFLSQSFTSNGKVRLGTGKYTEVISTKEERGLVCRDFEVYAQWPGKA